MPLTPEQRILRARIAAHTKHAMYGAAESTAPARAARWQRYLDRVDPDHLLPEAERERRARSLLSADMARLALKSATVRAKRKAAS